MVTKRRPLMPEIRCFPDSDPQFREDVQAAIVQSRQTIRSGERLIERVRQDLLDRYPKVAIHERERLAEVGEHQEHWYVFRDGRIA